MTMTPRSSLVTQGRDRAPNRGMLRALGMTDADFTKPQIGIASSWNSITPCNMSLRDVAASVGEGVQAGGGFPMEFGTITVSDVISMGHEGMHFSLVSREVIADSVETVMQAERLDGMVTLAGCDKSIPAMLMAAARLDVSSVLLYAGSLLPGHVRLEDGSEHTVNIVTAFEAVGANARGLMSDGDLDRIERAVCPSAGTCGGMYTANTMASAAEAMGMALPGSSSPPAVDARRSGLARLAGESVIELIRRGITTRDIITRESLENAITVVMALGGSTNAVLHLPAIAHECGFELELDEFQRISERVPLLADLKPFGEFVMFDLDRVGGVPVVMRMLLDEGLLHGDCLTVTGRTVAENLAAHRSARCGRTRHPCHRTSARPDRWHHDPRWIDVSRGSRRQERRRATSTSSRGPRACSTARRRRWRRSRTARSSRATSSSSGTRGPRAAPACARC